MKDNFHNEFERFLRENADHHRMYPSEKVWKGIETKLHHKPWKYGLVLSLLLVFTGALVAYVMIKYPTPDQDTIAAESVSDKDEIATANDVEDDKVVPIVVLSNNNQKRSTFFQGTTEPLQESTALAINNTEKAVAPIVDISVATKKKESDTPTPSTTVKAAPTAKNALTITKLILPTISDYSYTENIEEPATTTKEIAIAKTAHTEPSGIATSSLPKKNSKKAKWQFYVSPTVSYRRLSDNKPFLIDNAATYNPDLYKDVSKVVIHRPDIGLQLGAGVKIPVSATIDIKLGAQFNISRYHIKAYRAIGDVATIALDQGPQGFNYSISRSSQYRTKNGNNVNWLQNMYYSASLPIGAEIKLSKNKTNYWSLASTIQPTFVLSNRAYLLSTDFKNYVEVPDLIRRVNVNAGIELLRTFEGNKITWQVGPQFRYQLNSSFVNKYPVKENLFDFGLKMGVSINQ